MTPFPELRYEDDYKPRRRFSHLKPKFSGPDYDPALDCERLTKQIGRIFDLMKDGQWRTLEEIAEVTKDPQASISAQLRHLKKPQFGGHTLKKKRRGTTGAWEYSIMVFRPTFVPENKGIRNLPEAHASDSKQLSSAEIMALFEEQLRKERGQA